MRYVYIHQQLRQNTFTMKKKTSGNGIRLKDKGAVWKTKVGIISQVTENSIQFFEKAKKWKIKIILN